MHLRKHILDYRKKQTGTLRISENVTFTNDDVMNYVIGALQKKLPRALLPFNPALIGCLMFSSHSSILLITWSVRIQRWCSYLLVGFIWCRQGQRMRKNVYLSSSSVKQNVFWNITYAAASLLFNLHIIQIVKLKSNMKIWKSGKNKIMKNSKFNMTLFARLLIRLYCNFCCDPFSLLK